MTSIEWIIMCIGHLLWFYVGIQIGKDSKK
jgi:hypothetical protein